MSEATDEPQGWECIECGGQFGADDEPSRHTSEGAPLCENCRRCADCGAGVERDHFTGNNADGDVVCNRCSEEYVYSEVEDCTLHRDNAVYVQGAEVWCSESYAQRNYFWHEDSDEWCDYEPEDQLLFEYNEDALDHVRYDRKAIRAGALLLGVELEMEPRGSFSQGDLVEALGGRAHSTHILKYDGSIPSGAELVTAPLTLAEHRGGRLDWKGLLDAVRGKAMSGAGTHACGIHIHANKLAVSPLTIGKLLVFLNSDRTDELVTLIAQRRSNGYCEKKEKRVSDARYGSESRYERLNITPATLEFRIFRGNLRAARVLKNLEFCVAAIGYCTDASIREVDEPERFLTWLVKREKEYPMLVGFLREKGALPARKANTREAATCV